MKNKTKRTIKSYLEKSKNIIATAAGLGINYYIGDLTGVSGEIIKTSIDATINKITNDFDTRKLSDLEIRRVADVMLYAIEDIKAKLKQGQKIRDDGFFKNEIDDKSDSDEIFEGVIIAAQREFQNKKLKYFGKLLSNVSFRKDVTRDEVVQLIQIAERLSYRQYILIMIIAQSQIMKHNNIKLPYMNTKMLKDNCNMNYKDISVFQDIYEMYRMGIINGGGSIILEMGYIVPSSLEIQGVGVKLYELMELDKIPEEVDDFLGVFEVVKDKRCHIEYK